MIETEPAVRDDSALAGQVARLFFDRQLTKVEIAGRLGISRFRVARLLDRALADGIVRIEFRDVPAEDRALARQVEERYGLDLCVVASTADDPTTAAARLAAGVLDDLLTHGVAIGVAWGSTVSRVVREMPARRDPTIHVVQLAGGSSSLDPGADPGDVTRVLAERLGGRGLRIHAPAFVESAELRDALVRQPEIAATVERFADVSIALLGIGAFGPDGGRSGSSLLRSGALPPAAVRQLIDDGAIGDLLVHPFDASGSFLAPEIGARAVSIGVDELRRVRHVVAVATGAEKATAIRGALRTGVVRILVTDAAAATVLAGGGGRGSARPASSRRPARTPRAKASQP